MDQAGEMDERVVQWLDLVRPKRSLERRVRRSAHLDALRGVGSTLPAGDRRSPAAIGEIAAWEAGTLRALSGRARSIAGRNTARIDDLKARIAALGPGPEQRLAMYPPAGSAGSAAGTLTASSPEAQARRRMRLDAGLWAAADAERAVLQAQLAREEGMRAALIDEARETARQCHESSLALQHLYWAVRIRWSRRSHGAPPAPSFADVALPDWVSTPEVLYGGHGRREETT